MKSKKANLSKRNFIVKDEVIDDYRTISPLKKTKFCQTKNNGKELKSKTDLLTEEGKKCTSKFNTSRKDKTVTLTEQKKLLKKHEKENDFSKKSSDRLSKNSKRSRDHILKNVKVESGRCNIVSSDSDESFSDDSSSCDDFLDLFCELKKNGVKTDLSKQNGKKKLRQDKNHGEKLLTVPVDNSAPKNKPELEKSLESLTLNHKRILRKRLPTIQEELSPKVRRDSDGVNKLNDFSTPPKSSDNFYQLKLNGLKRDLWKDDSNSVKLADENKTFYKKKSTSNSQKFTENESNYKTPNKRVSDESNEYSGTPIKNSKLENYLDNNTPRTTRRSSRSSLGLGDINVKNDENIYTLKSIRSRKSAKDFYEEAPYENCKDNLMKDNIKENYGLRTPSAESIPGTPTTPLEKARTSLHVSSVPESLPCREREFKNIFSFLENKLLDGIGGCMYISGVPGTGKTATVTQVINKLKGMAEENKLPRFKYIEINGMRLADPRQAYVLLWQGLLGKKEKISTEQAQRKLDAWFGKKDPKEMKMPTLLLIDELDLICTRKQDVVYNLLDWPTKSPSHLIVLTIANTMDMPERLFKGRVTSRLGLTRLTFLPYTFKQLEEIVLSRLMGLDAFTLDAVRLVTRKVAAVSGDARRSLDICRRATELPAPDETVKICHIEQAIREMTNSNSVKVIRSCSQMEKLFLRSVFEVTTRTGIEEVDLRDVIEHFLALCTLEGFSRLPISYILLISNKLKCFRLLFINNSQRGILQRLTLNVSEDDIHYGLRCDA